MALFIVESVLKFCLIISRGLKNAGTCWYNQLPKLYGIPYKDRKLATQKNENKLQISSKLYEIEISSCESGNQTDG